MLLAGVLWTGLSNAQPAPSASASASAAHPKPGAAPSAEHDPRDHDRPDPGSNTCVTCHSGLPELKLSRPAEQFSGSVHADDRIGCVACHNGDARNPTVGAHDREAGFTVKRTHESVAEMCGGCHANARFIRRFNGRLRTDQAELFPLSLHGKLANAGDHNAPTCTTCHGIHDIVPISSAEAPTHVNRVADLCSKCHDDRRLMDSYGLPSNQHAKWLGSAHARALLAGNHAAPSCTGCHGPHSATPPKTTTVGRVCGQCHTDQLEAFRHSPHSKAFLRLGLSDCVPCHDAHEARRLSFNADSAEAVCNRCHSRDAKPREIGSRLATMVQAARQRLFAAKRELEQAHAEGIRIHGAEYAIHQIATEEQRLTVAVHSLDPERLREPFAAVQSAADRSQKLLADAQQIRELRRRGYYVAIGLASLLLVLLSAHAVRLARRRHRTPP